MTGMSSIFTSYHVNSKKVKVHMADGSYHSIVGHQDISTTSNLLLSSILHVPNFTLNLLAISHLTKTKLQCYIFFPSYYLFQDLVTKKTIGIMHEKDGLYFWIPIHL